MVQCFVENSCFFSDDITRVVLWLIDLIVVDKEHVAVLVHEIIDLAVSLACLLSIASY